MLTAEIRVNGALIAHVYAHNLMESPVGLGDQCKYEYETYRIGDGWMHAGTVRHKRKDGELELIRKVIADTQRAQGGQ